jgi:hypothetical protein
VTGANTDWVAGLTIQANTITNSYATGTVRGGDQSAVGGFTIGGASTDSYSAGSVGIGTKPPGRSDKTYLGGFTVYGASSQRTDYWDIDTSGRTNGCGYKKDKRRRCRHVTGLSDAQLKSALPNGFDPAIWGEAPDINNGYPYLLANPPPK